MHVRLVQRAMAGFQLVRVMTMVAALSVVEVWQMHFCSLTGLRDETFLEFRLSKPA